MDIKNLLGKRIREYRLKYGLTQFQLAEKLGIDDKHLSRIELGKNMPQANVIAKLAEVFDVEPKSLFEFSHLAPIQNVREDLNNIISNLSDEQIILTYKYVKTLIEEVVKILQDAKQPQSDFVKFMDNFKNPYLVLIACILSLRTNDKTTYPATLRMLELAKTPQEMMNVKVEDLAKAIYPVGFYQNKAGQIIELSKILVEKYNGKVPDSIDELCKFRGVGRKTANLVMTLGFGVPAICVDVHVHRIFNRLGYIKTKNPEETEFALREKLPIKYWIPINTLLVTHGQNVCKPVNPKCDICPIAKYCQKVDVKNKKD